MERNEIGKKIMADLYADFWKQQESIRVLQAQKLYDYYFNDRARLIAYVQAAFKIMGFKDKTINKMNVRMRNIVPKVIDKVCQVYKQPAQRLLDGGVQQIVDEATKDVKTEQSKADAAYQELLLNSTINTKSKEWHKQGKFFNCVLVQPIVVKNKKASAETYMDFIIHTPAYTSVETDQLNTQVLKSFAYPVSLMLAGKDKEEDYLVVWTEKEHYLLNKQMEKIAPLNNNGMINPYKRLPVAVLRFKDDPNSFFGEGRWSLVDGVEEIAVQATNLYRVSVFQTHGQAVSINAGLKGEVEVGEDKILQIENAGAEGKQSADFYFRQASPLVAEVKDLIDWTLRSLQTDEGLNPNSAQIETNIASGVAKIMDNADLNEIRADDRQVLEDFEHDLFEVIRVVASQEQIANIGKEAKFSIRFAEPKVVKTVDEQIKEADSGIKNGIMSRVDLILEKYPELTREQAEQKLQQNLIENKKWEDKFGLFTDDTKDFDTRQKNNETQTT
jgi:hypothetical protein